MSAVETSGSQSISAGPGGFARPKAADTTLLGALVERWAGFVPYAILAYFMIQTVLRLAISGNLEIDEAEIARHGAFQLGYGNSNPPLYDWIVISLWKLTGSWPASLAIAKNGLLASTYLLLFWSGRLLFGTKAGAASLALSLLLMPQIVWHAQITLSHSTAAAAASAAAIATLVWLLDRQTWERFMAFGLALGATLLSKYSATLLIVALACAIATVPETRRLLLDRRLLLSVAIAVAMAAPHFLWMLFNLEMSTARLAKLTTQDSFWSRIDIPVLGLDGLLSSLQVLVISAALLVIVWSIARWVSREEACASVLTPLGALFSKVAGRALVAGLVLLGLVVLIADVHHVSDRYLAQFLLLLPVWLSLQFPLAFRPRAMRRFLATSLVLAAVMTLAWPQLALFGNHRFAYPYDAIAHEVAAVAGPDAAILMERPDYATNIVLRMPQGRVFEAGVPAPTIAALWDSVQDRKAALMELAGPCYQFEGSVQQIAFPFHYFSGNEARLSLAVLRLEPAAAPPGTKCGILSDPASDQH